MGYVEPSRTRDRSTFVPAEVVQGRKNLPMIAGGLLVGALSVGGAGQNFPVLSMLLELGALVAAVMFLWQPGGARLPTLSRCALGLLAAVILLPLAQLIPLPPVIWQALPGREIVTEIDRGLGLSIWRPLTLDTEGTVRAVLTLIPASVLFVLALYLNGNDRRRLLLVVGGFALFNALLGISQLATGGAMTPYPSAHTGYPVGLFVNRNHTAVLLLLSMPMIAAFGARALQRSSAKIAITGGTLAALTIIALVVIGTTSRMALVLLPLSLGASALLLFARQSFWRMALPSVLVLGAVAAVISWVGGFNRNIARFSSLHDGRFDYWDDVSWALHHYGLAGTGFGTFIPVYQTAESLSSVGPQILNHAHNDFIEIVLEGGVAGVVLLLVFFAIMAAAVVQLMRKRRDFDRASVSLAAATGVMVVLIFSLVDYPLRMPALSSTFALLCACLLPSPQPAAAGRALVLADRRGTGTPAWKKYGVRTLAVALAAAAGVFVVQAGLSSSTLMGEDNASAASWAPWSSAARQGLAEDALARSNPKQAQAEALAALKLSPIDAVSLRTAAMARSLGASSANSQQLMQIALQLGWRDPVTQLWAIAASEQTGEPRKAVERARALFQQQLNLPAAVALLLRDAPNGPTAKAVVAELAGRPAWRAQFIATGAALSGADLERLALLASRLDAGPAPLSIEEAKPLLDRLIKDGKLDAARRLWAETHSGGLLANGGFEALSQRNGTDVPADWDASDEDLATIAVQEPEFAGNGKALRISAAARSGELLSQRLMLTPGRYLLSYVARSGEGGQMTLRWDLQCTSSDVSRTVQTPPASSSGWQRFSVPLAVPVQDCAIQRLALERPGDIHATEIWVDQITLQPAR